MALRAESVRRKGDVARRHALLVACEPVESRLLFSTLPTGFTDAVLGGNVDSPTALELTPDGRVFIAQQNGVVRVVKNDQLLPTPAANLSSEVDSSYERGLLGIAVDPQFAVNPYVYLYYTANGPNVHNRISRITMSGDTMLPGSEVALVDFPDIGGAVFHMGGAIHFGPDGKLYAAVGDHQQSAKSQDLSSVFGKILRFNIDGSIPSDNPYYGSSTGVARSVWCYGLRNPFTFTFQPGTGNLFIDDVGQDNWEEINVGVKGGNFGWPGTEGATNNPSYITPLYAYSHAVGQCITGGAFYSPALVKFPPQYVGKYFFTDFSAGWAKMLDPVTKQVTTFGTGLSFPTDMRVSSTGAIYYLERGMGTGYPAAGTGQIRKIDYPIDVAPVITNQPQDQSAGTGQSATFSISALGTQPMAYQWKRNNVPIEGATAATYTLADVSASDDQAAFSCTVSNIKGSETSTGAKLKFLVGDAPIPSIDTPTAGSKWQGGQTITFSGSATDTEDGALPTSAFTWEVDYLTGSVSRPLLAATTGSKTGSFVIPTGTPYTAPDVAYRLILTVRDSTGYVVKTTRDILPVTAQVTLGTNIPGLSLLIDGQPVAAGSVVTGVAGLQRYIGAPPSQTVGNNTYVFTGWSDAGTAEHLISWPAVNQAYTATYAQVAVTSLSTLTPTASTNGWGSYEKDRSNAEQPTGDGRTITLEGKTYAKGLGTHAGSSLTYALAGAYSRFVSDIGVDDEVGTNGSVVFQVYLDNVLAYDSGTMTGTSATKSINLDVSGKSTLRLVVTDAGNGNNSDHADWADARLEALVAPPPPPAVFAAPVGYATGTNSHGLATGHINGDTILDLVASNAGSANVSVLIGNGDGTFKPAANYAVGSEPKSVAIGDLNGDGKSDLVTADQGSGSVTVLLNTGTGAFSSGVSYGAPSGAHEATLRDLDGDNDLDIAVVGWGSNVVRTLFNQGDGSFVQGANYIVGNRPHSVAAGDFNGDGKPDLAVAVLDDDHVAILLNTGTGAFGAAAFLDVGDEPHSLRVGDLNGDGKLDVVTANEKSNNVSVLLGLGAGAFSPTANYATGSVPKGIAIGDIDGDNKPDLITANTAGNYPTGMDPAGFAVSVLRNLGNGTFGAPQTQAAGNTPFAVALGDCNNDGALDAATANWHSNDVTVLLNLSGDPGDEQPPVTPPTYTYLSDLTPTVATNGWGSFENDRSNGEQGATDGKTITLNGITFAKGLGVHAGSTLRYNLAGGYTRFTARIGVDDEVGNRGSVIFQVQADGVTLYTSPTMTGASATLGIDVDITGRQALTLIVLNSGDNSEADHADWADARLTAGAVVPPPPPPPPGTNVYLSQLTPTSSTNGWGAFENDRSNGEQGAADGKTITLNGVQYTRGIGTHANSEIVYALNGAYTHFVSDVGVDDEVGANGSVRFQVYADGALLFDSGTMTGSSATKHLDVDVTGRNTLRLVVTDAGNGGNSDHADWAGAELRTDAITPPPAPGGTNYLSDLAPVSSTNGWGTYERDRSNNDNATGDGNALTLNGVTYAKGLGVHARSELVYIVPAGMTHFVTDIGVDDEVGNQGSVLFKVLNGSTQIFASTRITGASATQGIDLAVTAGMELHLIVEDAGDGMNYDHADWAGARFL